MEELSVSPKNMLVDAAVFPVVIKRFESPDPLCKFNNPAGDPVPIPTFSEASIVIAVALLLSTIPGVLDNSMGISVKAMLLLLLRF
jgi:hypothetical protein